MSVVTNEERDYIDEAIYLPMILSLLERNKHQAEANFKLYESFLPVFSIISADVMQRLQEVHRYLSRNKIKVKELQRDELFTEYQFIVRGGASKHNYFNFHMRNQVQQRLTNFIESRMNGTPLIIKSAGAQQIEVPPLSL